MSAPGWHVYASILLAFLVQKTASCFCRAVREEQRNRKLGITPREPGGRPQTSRGFWVFICHFPRDLCGTDCQSGLSLLLSSAIPSSQWPAIAEHKLSFPLLCPKELCQSPLLPSLSLHPEVHIWSPQKMILLLSKFLNRADNRRHV